MITGGMKNDSHLQRQHFTKPYNRHYSGTIVEILKVYADPQRRTDLRNEASKEGAKKLMEVLEELHIPFI